MTAHFRLRLKQVLATLILSSCICGWALAHDDGESPGKQVVESYDGLVEVEGSVLDQAFLDPAADFSVYRKVALLDPYVSFRRNWERDQNRSRSRNLRAADIERIKTDVADLLRQIFVERLEAAEGYEIVTVAGDDVLLVRLAIVNLDVTAPDVKTAGRAATFTTTAGAATLYIELYDSVSGSILARAADRKTARRPGNTFSWSNSVSNSAEARRIFGRWADILRAFLDENYAGPDADLPADEAADREPDD